MGLTVRRGVFGWFGAACSEDAPVAGSLRRLGRVELRRQALKGSRFDDLLDVAGPRVEVV